jgi:hypothetical protein
MTFRTTHLLVALVLLAAGGVAHGMWTHRWSQTAVEDRGQDLLAKLDGPVGIWNPGKFLEIDANDIPKKTKTASRQFLSEKSKKSIVVSVTSGIPGVVAAHTPDVCFLGSGYTLKAPPTIQTVPLSTGGNASFYVADFQKTRVTGTETVRVRWAWSAEGTWQAPTYPRLFFARSQLSLPVLYKLYIVHHLTDDEDLTKNDPYRTFSADLAAALSPHVPH